MYVWRGTNKENMPSLLSTKPGVYATYSSHSRAPAFDNSSCIIACHIIHARKDTHIQSTHKVQNRVLIRLLLLVVAIVVHFLLLSQYYQLTPENSSASSHIISSPIHTHTYTHIYTTHKQRVAPPGGYSCRVFCVC